MNRICFIFSGQGTQIKGMGDLFKICKNFNRFSFIEKAKAYLLSNNDYITHYDSTVLNSYNNWKVKLGNNLEEYLFNAELKEITNTQIAQPLLFLHQAIVSDILKESLSKRNDDSKIITTLGHSIGELSSIHFAEMLDFNNSLELVCFRGYIMSKLYHLNQLYDGSMVALFPTSIEKVKEIQRYIKTNSSSIANQNICDVGVINAPSQIVLSGNRKALEKAIVYGKKKKLFRMAKWLNVSTAFHSSLLENASIEFNKFLTINNDNIRFLKPNIPIIGNITAMELIKEEIYYNNQLVDQKLIIDSLSKQISNTVKWSDSIKYCFDRYNPDAIIEVGIGGVQSKLINQIIGNCSNLDKKPSFNSYICGDNDDLEFFSKDIVNERN